MADLSGRKAVIYSVKMKGESLSLLDKFISDNIQEHEEEVLDILARIELIATKTGARSQFFKDHEGKEGDPVCALYDNPDKNLRLYCIRYHDKTIILGDGGYKPKNIRAWQEKDDLSAAANQMIEIAADIDRKIRNGEIKWSKDYTRLTGNTNNIDEDDD